MSTRNTAKKSTPHDNIARPLEGIRVLEFCHFVSGPKATSLLADQGAEVIKIEPLGGDPMRHVGPARNGFSAAFITWNRNKSSIAIDLTKEEGQRIVQQLTAGADVVLNNYRPGVMERLGIDEPALRKHNDSLIYVAMTGFGPDGPYVDGPAYDCIIQGLSGLGAAQASYNDKDPSLVRTPIADKLSGMVASQAVTAALCGRYRTGKGAYVEVSMIDIAVSFAWGDVMGRETFIGESSPGDILYEGNWLHPTSDGAIICQPTSQKDFVNLVELSGRTDLLENSDLGSLGARSKNVKLYSRELKSIFKNRTTNEWAELLKQRDVPYGRLLSSKEVIADVQVRHNELYVESEHPVAGMVRECRPAARFDGENMAPYKHTPRLGEHTDVILKRLGYDDASISDLRSREIIA